jgi:hypothetical protein
MMRNLVNGAVGGALATAVYSAVLMAGDKAGLLEDRRPRRLARASMRRSRGQGRGQGRRNRARPGLSPGVSPGESVVDTIAHYAFGAGCGSILGLLSTGQRVPAPIGAAYGLAVWYLGYQKLAPSVGACPPAGEDRAGRQALLLAGHLLWGASLTVVMNRLRFDKTAMTSGLPVRNRELQRNRTPSRQPAPLL